MADQPRFSLDVAEWVQGDFNPVAPVTVVLTFQVNCPGCFQHALPLLLDLATDADLRTAGLQPVLLATAFEDYELNTKANLTALIESGTTVGETRRRQYPATGKCPLDLSPLVIGWDNPGSGIVTPEALAEAEAGLLEAKALRGSSLGPPMFPPDMRERITAVLADRARAGSTFSKNKMGGTPTWAVLDSRLQVVQQLTGHPSPPDLRAAIVRATKK